jgi:hypothetical protein
MVRNLRHGAVLTGSPGDDEQVTLGYSAVTRFAELAQLVAGESVGIPES